MKITIEITGDLYEGSCTTTVETEKGTKSVSFGSGEPEDMCLARDLNDAMFLDELLVLAYEAGKNGESIEIIKVKGEEE